jgi:hypothetical protein
MLCHVTLVRTDISEERSASIIRVTRISELGTTLSVTSNRRTLQINTMYDIVTANIVPNAPNSCYPDDEGHMFFQNVGSYKSHTV